MVPQQKRKLNVGAGEGERIIEIHGTGWIGKACGRVGLKTKGLSGAAGSKTKVKEESRSEFAGGEKQKEIVTRNCSSENKARDNGKGERGSLAGEGEKPSCRCL